MLVRRWSKHAFTFLDSQLINGSWITWICSARKQWGGLIHLSISRKWGKLLQSEKSNFQPSKMQLAYIITSLQKRHPLHAAGGTAWLAGPGSPHAELPWREETNYLFSESSLSFTWETHFYFPHLRIHRKHLSSSYFLIWVMNFYFLRFSETPVFTVSRMSINALHISRQFSFQLPIKERNLCIVYPALWDSRSPALLIPPFQIPENVFRLVLHLGDSAVSSLCSSAGREC